MRTAIWAATLLACSAAALPAAAKGGFEHRLERTLQLENGEIIQSPGYLGYDRGGCLRALKQVEIGKVIPRGNAVFADGKTHSYTIIAAKCVITDRKN